MSRKFLKRPDECGKTHFGVQAPGGDWYCGNCGCRLTKDGAILQFFMILLKEPR